MPRFIRFTIPGGYGHISFGNLCIIYRKKPFLSMRRTKLSTSDRRIPGLDSSRRLVQRHSGANESLQSIFINLVALTEVDGAPGVAFETRVKEAWRIIQRGALGEGHLHDILVRLISTDQPVMRPHRVPLHFHSSTTLGSACLIKARSRVSISPRQSCSSSIRASISSEGDAPFWERNFLIPTFCGPLPFYALGASDLAWQL